MPYCQRCNQPIEWRLVGRFGNKKPIDPNTGYEHECPDIRIAFRSAVIQQGMWERARGMWTYAFHENGVLIPTYDPKNDPYLNGLPLDPSPAPQVLPDGIITQEVSQEDTQEVTTEAPNPAEPTALLTAKPGQAQMTFDGLK